MNEQQPNSQGHEDRSEWQRRNTRLQWLVVDLVPEACSTAMTDDRHD